MKKKIFGTLAIIVVLGLAYFLIKSSTKPQSQPSSTNQGVGGGEVPGIPEGQKTEEVKKLVYRQNLADKQVVELSLIDADGKNKKLVFTDSDEDFRIRLVDGLLLDSILVFGTPLNETSGSIWQIKTDGTGGKKQLIDKITVSSFTSNGEKIAFISYDNINGVFNLWTMNMDGRFKTKILESKDPISDPIMLDKSLAFVVINKEGDGVINTISEDGQNKKEILKASGQFIEGLSFSSNKFAFIKKPKTAGSENLAEVYVCDQNGQNEKRITQDTEADAFPVLSKDGSTLAFYKKGMIWTGKSDGTDQKAIVEGTQPIGFVE